VTNVRRDGIEGCSGTTSDRESKRSGIEPFQGPVDALRDRVCDPLLCGVAGVPVAVPGASDRLDKGTAAWGGAAFPVAERNVFGLGCWLEWRCGRERFIGQGVSVVSDGIEASDRVSRAELL